MISVSDFVSLLRRILYLSEGEEEGNSRVSSRRGKGKHPRIHRGFLDTNVFRFDENSFMEKEKRNGGKVVFVIVLLTIRDLSLIHI